MEPGVFSLEQLVFEPRALTFLHVKKGKVYDTTLKITNRSPDTSVNLGVNAHTNKKW